MGVSIRSILVGCYQQKRNEDKETPVIVARPRDFYKFFFCTFCPYIFSNIPMTKMFKIKFKKTQVQHPPRFHSQFNDDNTIEVHVSFNAYVNK